VNALTTFLRAYDQWRVCDPEADPARCVRLEDEMADARDRLTPATTAWLARIDGLALDIQTVIDDLLAAPKDREMGCRAARRAADAALDTLREQLREVGDALVPSPVPAPVRLDADREEFPF
jgi:hypothetical protein